MRKKWTWENENPKNEKSKKEKLDEEKTKERIEDGRKFWPHINPTKPFKHKKTTNFFGQPMFPPKIRLVPTF